MAESIPGLPVIKSSKILVSTQFFARSLCLPKLQRHTEIHDGESSGERLVFLSRYTVHLKYISFCMPHKSPVDEKTIPWIFYVQNVLGNVFLLNMTSCKLFLSWSRRWLLLKRNNITFHTLRTICWNFVTVKIIFLKWWSSVYLT